MGVSGVELRCVEVREILIINKPFAGTWIGLEEAYKSFSVMLLARDERRNSQLLTRTFYFIGDFVLKIDWAKLILSRCLRRLI